MTGSSSSRLLRLIAREFVTRRVFWNVLVLALISLVLGTIGFRKLTVAAAADGDHGIAGAFYRALQLFALESGAFDRTPPWSLAVARYLAPFSLALGAGSVLYTIVRGLAVSFNVLRLGGWSDHIIVCGVGNKGALFAERLQAAGHRVVVIETASDAAGARSVRGLGVPVIVGDARSRRVLEQAGVSRARQLVALCGRDDVNAEVLVQCRAIGDRLACVTHIDDPELAKLLGEGLAADRTETDSAPLHFFSIWDRAAWSLYDRFLARLETGDGAARGGLLLIGRGSLLRSLDRILATADWRWTIFGPALDWETTAARETPARSIVAGGDLRAERVGHWLQAAAAKPDPACVVVDCDDDETTLAVGLRVASQLAEAAVPVVLMLHETVGLGALLESSRMKSFANLRVFQVHDMVLHPDLLLLGETDRLAMAIHAHYVRQRLAAGALAGADPALCEWRELPETLRLANRAQAEDVWRKLSIVGLEVISVLAPAAGALVLREDEVEQLARLEHERWSRERAAQGWKHGPVKDLAKRRSPMLVRWEELPAEGKDTSRAMVRAIPLLLARAGFGLRRPGPSEAVQRTD